MRGMITFDQLVAMAGGQSEVARRLNVKQQNVQYHVKNSVACPADWVLEIESATGIPCWEIRPDLYPPERFKKAA